MPQSPVRVHKPLNPRLQRKPGNGSAGGCGCSAPGRLRAVLAALDHPDFVGLLREQAPEASFEQLTLVHPAAYVRAMFDLAPAAGEVIALDADTFVNDASLSAARRAAGGVIAGVDAVMEGWADAAFAAVRPPGHHAEPDRPMGFCLFASVAVAAQHARKRWGLRRIARLVMA